MMEGLREYILSVVAAAILCGILQSLIGKQGSSSGAVQLLCGLIMAFTVIRPIATIRLEEWSILTSQLEAEAMAAAAVGQDYYEDSIGAIIKQDCEAYILDKAQSLDASLQVDVHITGDGIPDEITLTGNISSYAKQKLESAITEDLGIPKERQLWIG